MSFPRDRRQVGPNKNAMDPESQERENDSGIDALSERIGLLKQATHGIRNEVESQHSILDRMTDGMVGTHGILTSAQSKFKVVMANKQNKQLLMSVCGIVAAVLLLYYLFW